MSEKKKKHGKPWFGAHADHLKETQAEAKSTSAHDESPSTSAHVESPAMQKPEVVAPPKVSFSESTQVTQEYTEVQATTQHHIHEPQKHKPKKHKMKHYACNPIICEPQYVVHDHCIPLEVPVIHPIIHVHRYHYQEVPTHYYQTFTQGVPSQY